MPSSTAEWWDKISGRKLWTRETVISLGHLQCKKERDKTYGQRQQNQNKNKKTIKTCLENILIPGRHNIVHAFCLAENYYILMHVWVMEFHLVNDAVFLFYEYYFLPIGQTERVEC